MDAVRLQYLERMGIPVYLPRSAPVAAATFINLRLGPGDDPTLFVCAGAADAAGHLAADLARAVRGAPVWSWPENLEAGMSLEQAVHDRLFSTVVVFGEPLARSLLGESLPEQLGAARLVIAPGMSALGNQPGARRECWKRFRGSGIAARR